MTGADLLKLFKKSGKRCLVVGTVENGIVAGLDLEARLFAVMNGVVLNRVNSPAIAGITTRAAYLNPGGDGLWPAPEGTCRGYEYATGAWRVPPGLTGARFLATATGSGRAKIEAEVDLINADGTGVPTIFCRDVAVSCTPGTMTAKVIETIRYLGARGLSREVCLLAPWSLCQFDCGPGCEVVFPFTGNADVWDFYDPSSDCRCIRDGLVHARTDSSKRYQIGIGSAVPWIEFRNPSARLVVRRSSLPLAPGQAYIDISDAPPANAPLDKGTRYSVYSDANGFMEIEAVGGCPQTIEPGIELSVEIITEYKHAEY